MLNWLILLHFEAPDEPSIRRVLALCSFVFGVVICFLGLKYEISTPVEAIVIMPISLAFTALAAGRFAEAMDHTKRPHRVSTTYDNRDRK